MPTKFRKLARTVSKGLLHSGNIPRKSFDPFFRGTRASGSARLRIVYYSAKFFEPNFWDYNLNIKNGQNFSKYSERLDLMGGEKRYNLRKEEMIAANIADMMVIYLFTILLITLLSPVGIIDFKNRKSISNRESRSVSI